MAVRGAVGAVQRGLGQQQAGVRGEGVQGAGHPGVAGVGQGRGGAAHAGAAVGQRVAQPVHGDMAAAELELLPGAVSPHVQGEVEDAVQDGGGRQGEQRRQPAQQVPAAGGHVQRDRRAQRADIVLAEGVGQLVGQDPAAQRQQVVAAPT
ncbi:hypothetical protein GCM10020220_008340 [Nonomuraea rubra]